MRFLQGFRDIQRVGFVQGVFGKLFDYSSTFQFERLVRRKHVYPYQNLEAELLKVPRAAFQPLKQASRDGASSVAFAVDGVAPEMLYQASLV